MVEHFNFSPSSDNFSLYLSAASALDDIHLFLTCNLTDYLAQKSAELFHISVPFPKTGEERQRGRETEMRKRDRGREKRNTKTIMIKISCFHSSFLLFRDKFLERYLILTLSTSPSPFTFCSIAIHPFLSPTPLKQLSFWLSKTSTQWKCFSLCLTWFIGKI